MIDIDIIHHWLVVLTISKHISQLGLLVPYIMEKNHVWNHQPDHHSNIEVQPMLWTYMGHVFCWLYHMSGPTLDTQKKKSALVWAHPISFPSIPKPRMTRLTTCPVFDWPLKQNHGLVMGLFVLVVQSLGSFVLYIHITYTLANLAISGYYIPMSWLSNKLKPC